MAQINQKTYQKLRLISLVLLSQFLTACSVGIADKQEQTVEKLGFHSHNVVRDYTDRLAHELVNNLVFNNWDSPLVISSFVAFEEGKQNINRLGRSISESLVGQIQVYGIPVVAAYNGDVDDINSDAKYVLSGVLVENERGFVVNARIIDSGNQHILSSASTFIPSFVSESL